MNVAFLDMCTPVELEGTICSDLEEDDIEERVQKLVLVLTQMTNVARLAHSVGEQVHPAADPVPVMDHERELNPQQKLLEFLLQRAGHARLRRKNAAMYRPRVLENGTQTGFYEYDCEISDFIFRQVSPARLHPEEYDTLTNKPSTPNQMINLLTSMPDPRTPFLIKDRKLFSFRNGVFSARDASFTPFDQRADKSCTTSQFFDCFLQPEWLTMDPFDISTPLFNKILTDQKLDSKACQWMYILCGRLLHNVGDLDDWQVTLYIRGVAGSGKSTILKVMAMMYEADDIGYLMSDGQPTFSDEHLYDKYIVEAMDMDKRTLFSATRINSMTSGEKLSVNRKYKTALNIKWQPPMVMASNAQPPWDDVAGNLVRRFVIFLFNYPVRNSDPQLFDKLRDEVPRLLVKMARLYLDAVNRFGNRSLWDQGILPTICHDAKRQYLVSSNALSAFLESESVIFEPHAEVSTSEFRRRLTLFTRENCDRKTPVVGAISKVDHSHLFAMYNCTIIERRTQSGQNKTVIAGLSLVDVPA